MGGSLKSTRETVDQVIFQADSVKITVLPDWRVKVIFLNKKKRVAMLFCNQSFMRDIIPGRDLHVGDTILLTGIEHVDLAYSFILQFKRTIERIKQ